MGNNNGLLDSLSYLGTNKVIKIPNSKLYFSFAFGDEIALSNGKVYYILNCDSRLWDEVKNFTETNPTEKEIITFWKEKSKAYKKSIWSKDFSTIEKEL